MIRRPRRSTLFPSPPLFGSLVARQYRCFRTVADALAAEGARIRDWSELAPAEHTSLERWFAENVAPVLTPKALTRAPGHSRSEEHTSELQSQSNLVCRLLLE